jgi:hypothetical protein
MIFCVVGTAQNFPIKHLLQDSVPIAFITPAKNFYFNLGDTTHNKYKPQQFIKNGNKLYLFLNGTGRLYETSVDNSNSCVFDRIDITDHFGYNIGSFAFSYNGGIYDLGGGGIWHINGQLRIYNTKAREWDIVKLNKEIPVLYDENLLWYDIKAHKIYIGLYSTTNDAVKTNTTDSKLVYDVMVLDLAATDWTKIGNLSSYLKLNNAQMKPVAMSPWGLLVCVDTKFSLIDYKNNQVLSLEAKADNDYQSLQRNINQGNCYFKDSTLYYGNNEARTLDSIPLHYSDFKPTGEVIYTIAATTVASSYLPWMIGGLLVLLCAAIFYILKYKVSIQVLKKGVINEVKQTALPSEDSSSNEINTNTTPSYFDEKELQVLQLLLDNSSKQLTTSIKALNNALGVTKKANDVQKKQRSDVMSSINKKFSFISQNEQPIIDKTRADIDKRSFEYFIANERLDEVKAVFTTI